jgi:hypothetical protein
MKVELKHQDTYDKTFFYMIFGIFFPHNYHIEKIHCLSVYFTISTCSCH